MLFELNKKEIREQLEEIEKIIKEELRPALWNGTRWYIYMNLHDEFEQLEIILKRNEVI